MTNDPKLSSSWDELPTHRQFEGVSFQIISGKRGTIARFELSKGTRTPFSRHPQEQFTCVLTGRQRYEIDGQQILVGTGDVVHVASNTAHRADVLEDSVVLDFFSPAWPDLPNLPKQ